MKRLASTVSIGLLSLVACGGGSAGPAGAEGPSGDSGAPGAQGAQGAQGPSGAQGAMGAGGPAGPAGEAGAPGAEGPAGPAGEAGAPGAQGPTGPAGAAAVFTDAGEVVGPTGPAGDAGPAGPTGPMGEAGAIGPTGPMGLTGDAGAIGPTGPTGLTGDAGATGATGATGPSGGIVPSTGLVGWYKSATDLSGNAQNLAVTGSVTTGADRFGNPSTAMYFDGKPATDFIQGTNTLLPQGTSPRTVSVVVPRRPRRPGPTASTATARATGSTGSASASSTPTADPTSSGRTRTSTPPRRPSAMAIWHNCVVTYDGTNATIYIDARYVVAGTPTLNTVGTTIDIGSSNFDHTAEPYTGYIDDVRIYSRVLSEDERGELYLEGGW